MKPQATPATPPAPWRGDAAGGLNAALVALPIELVYGLFAVAPLGLAWAEHGLRAALWACVLGGFIGALLRTTGGVVSGTASSTALLLGTLAASLMQHPQIQAGADPAAQVFVLLLACTALAGGLQWVFGFAGIGKVLKFVPYPVVAGLMCGVATLLVLTALRPALGMARDLSWLDAADHWRPLSTLVFLAALTLCFWLRRHFPRWPGPALALLAGTVLHHALAAWFGADALGARSSPVDVLLPEFSLWQHAAAHGLGALAGWVPLLLPYALAIAALASLESLLCLPLVEEARDTRTHGDRQLRTLGLVNAIGGLFGGTMVSGHPARTAINLASGARSAWSGVVYAVVILLAVLLLGSWLGLVPDSVTGAILVFMASRMVDDGTRRLALQVSTRRRVIASEQYRLLVANFSVVLLVAMVAVFGDMLKAVAVGVLAAMVLFVRAGMRPVVRRVVTAQQRRSLKVRSLAGMQALEHEGRRIVVLEVEGALFFGTADQLAREIDGVAPQAQTLILDLQRVSDVDPTGARSLLLVAKRLQMRGHHLVLAGANRRVERILQTMGLDAASAPVSWHDDLDHALETHEDLLLQALGQGQGRDHIALRDTGLAEGLSDGQCEILHHYLLRREFEANEAVFRNGDAGNSLFVATASDVDILLPLHTGKSRRLASFAPGVVFGEMALLDNKPRSADAVVKRPTPVWELTRERLAEIEQAQPEIARRIQLNLSRSLAERLRLTTAELRTATEH